MPGSRVTRERRKKRTTPTAPSDEGRKRTSANKNNNEKEAEGDIVGTLKLLTESFTSLQKTIVEHFNTQPQTALSGNNDNRVSTSTSTEAYANAGNNIECVPIYTSAADVPTTSSSTDNSSIPWSFANTRLNNDTSIGSRGVPEFQMQDSQRTLNNFNGNSSNYVHQNVPLSTQVPEKIKSQIWAGDYVDLNCIQAEEKEFKLVLSGSVKGAQKLGFKEESSKKLQNIDQWLSVFFIYMSVYLQRYPTESEAMLRYIETVRRLEKKGGNWRFYDEQFRKLKRTLGLSWDNNHQSLLLDARLDQANVTFSKQQLQPQIEIPNGFCQKYHSGISCKFPCKYSHRCFKCTSMHPSITSCPSTQGSGTNMGTSNDKFRMPKAPNEVRQANASQYYQQSLSAPTQHNFRSFRPNNRGNRI